MAVSLPDAEHCNEALQVNVDLGGQVIYNIQSYDSNPNQRILNSIIRKIESYELSLVIEPALHFIIQNQEELDQYELDDLKEIQHNLESQHKQIIDTIVKFPITSKDQSLNAWSQIEKLQSIITTLDTVPQIRAKTNQEILIKNLSTDLNALKNLTLGKIKLLKFIIAVYENTLKEISNKRPTRSSSAILKGDEPIPLSLILELNTFDLASEPYPILITKNKDAQEGNALATINEQEENDLTELVRVLSGNDDTQESTPNNFDTGLKIIQEKYGVTLNPNDPNLISTLNNIRTSQEIFQNIIGNKTNSNCQDPNFPAPQYQSTPITCTNQSDINTVSKPTLDFSIYKDPSVQNDAPHIEGQVKGVDESRQPSPTEQTEDLHLHNGDKKKQELGEALFPLVHRSHPTKSNKITGMLLELPNNEILNIIDSETLLSEYIQKAISALNGDDQSRVNSPHESDTANKLAQSRSENDHQNAVFQEVPPSLSYNADLQPKHMTAQQHYINHSQTPLPVSYVPQPQYSAHAKHLVVPQTNQQLLAPQTDQYPLAHQTNQYSLTPQTNQYQLAPQTSQYQLTSQLSQYPLAPQLSQYPLASQTNQYPPVLQTNSYNVVPSFQSQYHTVASQPSIITWVKPSKKVEFNLPPYSQTSTTMNHHQDNTNPLMYSPNIVSKNPSQYPNTTYNQAPHTNVYHADNSDQDSRKAIFKDPSTYQEYSNAKASSLSQNTPIGQVHPTYWTNMNQNPHNTYVMPVHNDHYFKPAISSQNYDHQRNNIPMINHERYQPSTHNKTSLSPVYKGDTKRNLNDNIGNEPAIVQLTKREAKELASTCFLVNRTVTQLSQSQNMDTQQLVDLLSNMSSHTRTLEKLENKVSSFHKNLIINQNAIQSYSPSLYQTWLGEVANAENLSSILQQKLYDADAILKSERITTSQLSVQESKQLPYKTFSGCKGMSELHIYEFLRILDNNFKIARTPDNIKATVLKKLLKSGAKLSIPEDLNNFTEIKNILISRFGNPIIILGDIMELHKNVGKIPSKYCPNPPWKKIEECARNHLLLIRKAEQLSTNHMAIPEIFSSGHRNFNLIKLMSHEYNEDLKAIINTTSESDLYRMIVQRFEQILASASSNMEHNEAKRKETTEKKYHETFETDHYALAYDKNPYEINIGRCEPDQCLMCETLQSVGVGGNYFENHVLFGPAKLNYTNNCPNYLALSVQERNNLITENKICPFCLKLKSACKNPHCGNKNAYPHPSGKPKSYVCRFKGCKNRVELCLEHIDLNKNVLELNRRTYHKRLLPDSSVGAFTTICNPVTYNIDSFHGKIKTMIINDNRKDPGKAHFVDYDDSIPVNNHDTIPVSSKVNDWLNSNEKDSILTIEDDPILDLVTPDYDSSAVESQNPYELQESIQNEYNTFRNNYSPDKAVMVSSPKKKNTPNKLTLTNTTDDKPLLLQSTEDLLERTNAHLLADNCKSIFIYSKLAGLTRSLSVLFDSGGGSSLTLSNVPGRQLYAKRNNEKAVALSGIGSGTTFGDDYIMSLPLLKGGSVAVNIYSVPEILRPMSRIDLEPALKFIKSKSYRDKTIDEKLKEEIARASIYKYIEGSLDLLLGVKLFAIFPECIHSLSCGLSIFKMKLKPSSPSTLYCLGGPWQHLENIKHIFPDGAVMLQSIDAELSSWRESCNSITRNHIKYSTIEDTKDTLENSILTFDEENEHIDSQKIWESQLSKALEEFYCHLEGCQFMHCMDIPPVFNNTAFCPDKLRLRRKLGQIYRHYFVKYNVTHGIESVKEAIVHLNNCMYVPNTTNGSPNVFIALQCDKEFVKELSTFQAFFTKYYPRLKEFLINPNMAHIPLIALNVKTEEDLCRAGTAFSVAINSWLNEHPKLQGTFKMIFKGAGSLDNKVLFIKPSLCEEALKSLIKHLMETFSAYSFKCNSKFIPYLTFAELKDDLFNAKYMMKQFEEIKIGTSVFSNIHMFGISHLSKNETQFHIKTLALFYDNTLPEVNLTKDPNVQLKDLVNYSPDSAQIETALQPSSVCQAITPNQNNNENLMLWKDISCIAKTLELNDLELTDREILLFQEDTSIDKAELTSIHHKTPASGIKGRNTGFATLMKDLKTILQAHEPYPKCPSCLECKACKLLWISCTNKISRTEHYEEIQMRDSITYDPLKGKFTAVLPLKEDPDIALTANDEQSKKQYYRIVKSLQDKPIDKASVLASFNKLIELGYIQKVSDLNVEIQDQIMKKQRYVIPWNVVYKQSISTPCRIVLNASAKTRTKKSLNSILCKGTPKLNMLPLILAMIIDPILVTADLHKFYNSCLIPPSQYHLQCVYWNESLDPTEEPSLYVLTTHFYGLASSGRILEMCLDKVADMHKENKLFYNLLKNKTYVDDLVCNLRTEEEADKIIEDCESILNKTGFKVKGFARSFKKPDDTISEKCNEHMMVSALGMIWIPELDILRYKVPNLDFNSTKTRGKVTSRIFTGTTLEEFNKFIPPKITLRMVASKAAALYDPIGFLQPWYLGLKHLLRLSCQATQREWDDTLPDNLRDQWVFKLWEMHNISKISFKRYRLPAGVTDPNITIIAMSDSGAIGKLQVFYALRKVNDEYSIQLIYSKSQLSGYRSVPCEELCSLHSCAETLHKICLSLPNVVRKVLITDSTVVSFWLAKDIMDLGPFHRCRVHNILSFIDKKDIFHIRSKLNNSDIGTKRPENLSCILPDSHFQRGPVFLTKGIEACESQGYLKNIENVILDPSLKPLAQDGIFFKALPSPFQASKDTVSSNYSSCSNTDKMITAFRPLFVHRVKERLDYHEYLVNPIEKPWAISVKILSIVIHFINKIKRKISDKKSSMSTLAASTNSKPEIFIVPQELKETSSYLCLFNLSKHLDTDQVQPLTSATKSKLPITYNTIFSSPQEMAKAREYAVVYFLRLASQELKQFYKPSMLAKHTVYQNGIYYSKQRFLETSQVSDIMGDEINIQELGINQQVPCSDRYSPTGISILIHYHRKVCNHQGVDRTWLKCLESIYVFQGQALMMDIVKGCFHCRRKLLKRIQTSFGPINKFSLTFAAVNRHVMLDISGPYILRAKLGGKATRSNSNKVKTYLLHTICLTSYLNSVAIVESYDSQCFLDGLHKIGSRFGYPATAWTDASASQLKALLGMNLSFSSMFGTILQETGIQICISGAGASSHQRQGRIEKSIHCLQQFLQNKKTHIESLTILQFDSVVSQASAFLNSMPLATKARHKGTISSSLISPFSFLLGRRSNLRAPAGYPSLHNCRGDILDKVKHASEGMFRFFTNSIPDLLLRPKSYNHDKTEIKVGDVILFAYEESPIAINYKLGLVMNLEYDSDNISRIAEIAYCLSQEQSLPVDPDDKVAIKQHCRFTRRGVHTIVKIYSISDSDINSDIDLINKQLSEFHEDDPDSNKIKILETNTSINLVISQLGYLVRNS